MELAWKTRLEVVAETEGGILNAMELLETVEVAVLLATIWVLETTTVLAVQPPVLVVYPPLVEVALSSSALIRR